MDLKRFVLYLCLPLAAGLCGCGVSGDYSALEELRVVETLGYDRGGAGVVLSASAKAPGEDAPPLRLRAEGGSIRAALDALQAQTPEGELFFAHTQYVVIGGGAAEAGAGELLDFVQRDEALRLGAWLFVAEGEAAALVAEAGGADFDVTEALASARRTLTRQGSPVPDLRETAVALSEYGAAPAALLAVEETEDAPALSAAGYGVWRENRLAARLTAGESELVGLFFGAPGLRARTLDSGVAVEYTGRALLTPRWTAAGTPGPLEVRLELRAGVAEGAGAEADPAAALEQSLAAELSALLNRARALDADFLRLGRTLRVDGGSRFYRLPADWLTRLEFQSAVEVTLTRANDLQPPGEAAA